MTCKEAITQSDEEENEMRIKNAAADIMSDCRKTFASDIQKKRRTS